MTLPHPVLAVDIGTLIGVIFVVIAILGWLINLIGAQNRPAPPVVRGGQRRPPRPRDDKLANEIELFLREVAGQKRQKPAHKPHDEVPIEVVAEAERRPRPGVVRPRPPAAAPRRPAQRPARPEFVEPAAPKPQQKPRAVPLGPQQREARKTGHGASLTEHLDEYMAADHLDKSVQDHLPHAVQQGVQQHLGMFSTAMPVNTGPAASQMAREITAMIRDPSGIRRAILINEILMPPKWRRRKSLVD